MPLRDHFRPPVSKQSSWEGFHGYWPATMVHTTLRINCPKDMPLNRRVHLGTFYEIDVCTFENQREKPSSDATVGSNGGVAIATYAPPEPTLAVDAEIPEQYEYPSGP